LGGSSIIILPSRSPSYSKAGTLPMGKKQTKKYVVRNSQTRLDAVDGVVFFQPTMALKS
jgi:hypothetical protein